MSDNLPRVTPEEALALLEQAYEYYTPLNEPAEVQDDAVEYFEYLEAA